MLMGGGLWFVFFPLFFHYCCFHVSKDFSFFFSKIEPNLFLGSIPLPSDIKKLKEDRIIAIVNLCEEMLGSIFDT